MKNCSRRQFYFFFLFVGGWKEGWGGVCAWEGGGGWGGVGMVGVGSLHISCKLPAWETYHMKWQLIFSYQIFFIRL